MIRSDSSYNGAFVVNLSRDKGHGRGLEFNSLSPFLLASGAGECDICIWDVSKPLEPIQLHLKDSAFATEGEISYLSWNSNNKDVLASTSFNGTTGVWDLRQQRQVIEFSDPVKRSFSVLQWKPDVHSQLMLASDDDRYPTLRIWDIRYNQKTPLLELVGHTKGVTAMSWCPSDNSFLLTCVKDNRTVYWNFRTAQIVAELPASFDVLWYSKIPGFISASSSDGKLGIYDIEGRGVGDISRPKHPKAPKWVESIEKRVSVSFGEKLIMFYFSSSEVGVTNLFPEKGMGLADRSSEFEDALLDGDNTSLKLFFEKKSQESETGGGEGNMELPGGCV